MGASEILEEAKRIIAETNVGRTLASGTAKLLEGKLWRGISQSTAKIVDKIRKDALNQTQEMPKAGALHEDGVGVYTPLDGVVPEKLGHVVPMQREKMVVPGTPRLIDHLAPSKLESELEQVAQRSSVPAWHPGSEQKMLCLPQWKFTIMY
jgi:hypothetical protein